MKQKPIFRLAAIILVSVLLLGAAALAEGDTALDPLVTLGYLTGDFSASILGQAQDMADELAEEMTQEVQAQGAMLAQAVADQPAQTLSTGYVSVTLAVGQADLAAAGAEVLVVSGALTTSAAVTDVTDGAVVAAGGTLQANHLYICQKDTTLTAAAAAQLLRQ